MITEVNGNLLTYPNLTVIGHQTNCLGVMGAGIAKQIKLRYPNVFKEYKMLCDNHDKDLLGECLICQTSVNTFVANLFGEYSFTESIAPFPEKRHTDYDALRTALVNMKNWCISFINENEVDVPLNIGIPYKIGCGLAGGDWDNVVYPMIVSVFKDEDAINLHIVKFA